MHTSTVTRKGQIVIPAALRRKLGLHEGTKVLITETAEGLQVRPINRSHFETFAGVLPGKGRAVDALLQERRLERAREDRGA